VRKISPRAVLIVLKLAVFSELEQSKSVTNYSESEN
jgi:hypothetical protein